MKNYKYCFSSWFIFSVWLSICRWNDVNNFVSIPNILFSSTTNCDPLWKTTLSGNPYNFHTLFLNNCTNPSTVNLSVVATKCVILDNLLQTTRIAFFPTTNGNFVMKSTIRYVYSFSSTSLNFSFPTGVSILFFILWHKLQPSMYFPTYFVTPSSQ